MNEIETALREGRTLLSEYEAKRVLASYGVPVTREVPVQPGADPGPAFQEIGLPLVLKGCSAGIAHKSERGLVMTDLRTFEQARAAFEDLSARLGREGAVLVQEMVRGRRELAVGLTRDPQFGPCVMFGLGGIFAEALDDVVFRVAPLGKRDALEMMQEIRGRRILGPVRGLEPVDLDLLAHVLIQVGRLGLEQEKVKELDINPVIIAGSRPVAADALIVLEAS
ncbi:MAG: acetate--CoA ligase family protein [Thermodesulfobacteriota bacterium]